MTTNLSDSEALAILPEHESTRDSSGSVPAGEATGDDAPALPGSLVLLLAVSAGLAVATLYYSQPMLGVLGENFGASGGVIGMVPMLTQLGYALGILMLAPLGDRYDRRGIILIKAGLLTAALLMVGLAPSIYHLLGASLVIGLTATLAQDVIPAAATLAPSFQRGKVVGTVMTGVLLGILLSRVVSGLVAEQFSWRAMFFGAAGSIALVGFAAWRRIPQFKPTTDLSYVALLRSLFTLWGKYSELRRAALAQGLLAAGFSAFWSTLAVMLHGAPFHMGSAVAGLFGLAGAAGALAAPLAGHLADRRGPEIVTRIGTGLTAFSFAMLSFSPWLSTVHQLWLLGIGTVGFDLGVQATLIAHQTVIYRIDPGARSRLNAVLFVAMFVGMAGGAAVGSLLLAQWGWSAVTGMAALVSLVALGIRLGSCKKLLGGADEPATAA